MVFALGGEQAIEQLESGPVPRRRHRHADAEDRRRAAPHDGPRALAVDVPDRAVGPRRARSDAARAARDARVPREAVRSASVLRSAIDRCLKVTAMTDDPALRSLIGRVDKLPSPPRLYTTLTKLADDPRASLDDVGRAISSDSAFAAKVMQIANSAAFGELNTTSLTQSDPLPRARADPRDRALDRRSTRHRRGRAAVLARAHAGRLVAHRGPRAPIRAQIAAARDLAYVSGAAPRRRPDRARARHCRASTAR